MNQLPMTPPSPEQQRRTMAQLHSLLASQVESYHRSRHMAPSTSISTELARKLMDSLLYCLDQAGGLFASPDAAQTLRLGQTILTDKHQRSRNRLALIRATAPHRQTECRWEALQCLDHYLTRYDHLHLAHHGPDDLFYPILTAPPGDLRGIDLCGFYLDILWIENQIYAGTSEWALEDMFRRMPDGTLNPCEQLLLNALARVLLDQPLDRLSLEPGDRLRLFAILSAASDEMVNAAADKLCTRLDLRDPRAIQYVHAILPILRFHLKNQPFPEGLFL